MNERRRAENESAGFSEEFQELSRSVLKVGLTLQRPERRGGCLVGQAETNWSQHKAESKVSLNKSTNQQCSKPPNLAFQVLRS